MSGRFSSFKKEYTAGFLLLTAAAVIWQWGFNSSYFTNPDAFDYAQMGRQLADGKGFSTLQVFPKHIRYLHETGYLQKENWPNLYRAPLPVVLNAFFYKLVGDIVKAAVLSSGIFYLLSVLVLYILAIKLTNFWTAVVAVVVYVSDRFVAISSYNGMTESLAAFLLLCLLLLYFSGKLSIAKCFLVGITCGLGYLARSQFVSVIPTGILLVWLGLEKKDVARGFVLLLVGFLIAAGPWFIRNAALTGNPCFSFFNSRRMVLQIRPVHSDIEMQLDGPVGTMDAFSEYGAAVVRKVLRNISKIFSFTFWAYSFSSASPFLFLFFASCIYDRNPTGKSYALFRGVTALLILCNFLLVCLVLHDIRFWVYLRPLVYIIGINEALRLFGRFRLRYARQLNLIVFCGLLLFGVFRFYSVAAAHKNRPSPVSPPEGRSYEFIKRTVRPDTLVACDAAYKVALYACCRSVRLPAFPGEILEINDEYIPIDYVLISPSVFRHRPPNTPSLYETYADYADFVKSEEFRKEFKLVRILPDGSALFKRLQ